VCDRVAIIDQGSIVALATPAQLIDRVGRETLELHVDHDPTELLVALRRLGSSFGEPLVAGEIVSVTSSSSPEELSTRAAALEPSRVGVRSMTVRPTTLNDVFLTLTNRRSAHETALAGALT
jgi:ABC-2 type transport system ATP-binding protein